MIRQQADILFHNDKLNKKSCTQILLLHSSCYIVHTSVETLNHSLNIQWFIENNWIYIEHWICIERAKNMRENALSFPKLIASYPEVLKPWIAHWTLNGFVGQWMACELMNMLWTLNCSLNIKWFIEHWMVHWIFTRIYIEHGKSEKMHYCS